VIPVEGGDDLHEGRDRGQFAPVEPDVGHAQRLGEARDLQMNEAIGRVEASAICRVVQPEARAWNRASR
jgi:hypothetical protein